MKIDKKTSLLPGTINMININKLKNSISIPLNNEESANLTFRNLFV